MRTHGGWIGAGTTTLLAALALGAKCPLPIPAPPGGGARDGGGTDARAVDGGAAGGQAGRADAGADANSAGGAGGGLGCVESDPNGVWTTEHPDLPVIGVAALASNDVWVSTADSVQHWDGTAWTSMLSRTTNETFGLIWASGPTDVWVAGDTVRRWNGSTWTDTGFAISDPIVQLWGLGPNDVWIVAARQFEPVHPVYHWDGLDWVETGGAAGVPALGGRGTIDAVWGSSPDDVWGFGSVTSTDGTLYGAILRWTEGQWQPFGDVADPSRLGLNFLGATGAGAHDIWLTGYDNVNAAALWHFDGTALVEVAGFASLGLAGFPWASCAGEVWLPVTDGRRALLAHDRDAASSVVELPGSAAAVVTGIASGEVWSGGQASASGALFHLHSTTDTQPVCGDVRLESGEQCDPPNGVTCDQNCQRIPTCGDGKVDPGEDCDPPAPYTCSATCRLIAPCGNGRLDPGEECDPPTQTGNPQCDQTCHIVLCGNGRIDPGEECDPPRSGPGLATPWCDSTCHIPLCGNGVIDPGETCDPPVGSWTPGQGTPTYCGFDCTTHDACVECHQICDADPQGFSACERARCIKGIYLPCGV